MLPRTIPTRCLHRTHKITKPQNTRVTPARTGGNGRANRTATGHRLRWPRERARGGGGPAPGGFFDYRADRRRRQLSIHVRRFGSSPFPSRVVVHLTCGGPRLLRVGYYWSAAAGINQNQGRLSPTFSGRAYNIIVSFDFSQVFFFFCCVFRKPKHRSSSNTV